MKALIQRVTHAAVVVEDQTVGAIGPGLLVLLGVERDDTEAEADRLVHKLLRYRVFPDADGKLNCSVQDCQGGILLVSQFTLAADTGKGLRPSFSSAAEPARARALYDYCTTILSAQHQPVATGQFAADMQVHLVNDGPVTFLLET